MAVDLTAFIPKYLEEFTEERPRKVITSDRWNELWTLMTTSANYSEETLYTLILKLNLELWSNNAASYIKNPPIGEGSGDTVAAQLTWLKDYLDDTNTALAAHKISADHDDRYYTQGEVDIQMSTFSNTLSEHVGNLTGAHTGATVTLNPTGKAIITADDVQQAIDQIETALASMTETNANAEISAAHASAINGVTYASLDARFEAAENDSVAVLATGTGTGIVLSVPGLTAQIPRKMITFIAPANNSGAATTIALNGLTAVPLYKVGTTTAPTLISGKAYTVWFNTQAACFFIKASAEGTAVAAHVLAPDTFSNGTDTGIAGTMVARAGDTAALSMTSSGTTLKFKPPEGYYDGVDDYVYAASTGYDAANWPTTITVFGRVGTMTERAGDVTALSSTVSGTTLKLKVPAGHYDGVSDYVTITDADFIAANIPSGKNLFGIDGTFVGKKFASGSLCPAVENNSITGLGFTPSKVVVTGHGVDIYDSSYDLYVISSSTDLQVNGSSTTAKIHYCKNNYNGSVTMTYDDTLCSIITDGFTFYANRYGNASSMYRWFAIA